ncbi:MAG TPA: thiamine-phosphate kinase [Acidocella sp.]|nr:thiamine-phosphate kinase [Acidocella sp.]
MTQEFARIETYFAPLAGEAGLGLKDDAAVFAPPPGRELVLTTDQMLEGVHFLSNDDPAVVARKLLRRNLSDLAAMGADPLGYLLTTALPADLPEDWLARFAKGLETDQLTFNIKLFGGDSSSSKHGIALTATVLGSVAPGMALRRNGAKPGDSIWVTGTIGDAALGLEARRGHLAGSHHYLVKRSILPTPRLGLDLAGIATAAIDVSDGLVQDLGHMARESGLCAVIRADMVPASPEAAALGEAFLETRLTGGDDYELILAVPPGKGEALKEACGDLTVTRIGMFQPGEGVHVLSSTETVLEFSSGGWSHF